MPAPAAAHKDKACRDTPDGFAGKHPGGDNDAYTDKYLPDHPEVVALKSPMDVRSTHKKVSPGTG